MFRCFFLLFVAGAVSATPLPTSSLYFYPCDSGVVDCGTFQHHNFGDFGLASVRPSNWDEGSLGPDFPWRGWEGLIASNSKGQVLGSLLHLSGYTFIYGESGATIVPTWTPDSTSSLHGDISEHGVWALVAYRYFAWTLVGRGSEVLGPLGDIIYGPVTPGTPARYRVWDIHAINESNQLLVTIVDWRGTEDMLIWGVASPYQVPEPSAAGLVILGIAAGYVLLRRRIAK